MRPHQRFFLFPTGLSTGCGSAPEDQMVRRLGCTGAWVFRKGKKVFRVLRALRSRAIRNNGRAVASILIVRGHSQACSAVVGEEARRMRTMLNGQPRRPSLERAEGLCCSPFP